MKFNIKSKAKLDNPQRRKDFPAKETLKALGLEEDMDWGDIGAGIGYFTLEGAKMISSNKTTYALDISKDMLDFIESRLEEEGLKRVILRETEEYDLKLEDSSLDFGLLVNVLHEVQDRKRFLKEVRRILRPGARLGIIDFKKQDEDFGPPKAIRISEEELLDLAEESGFKLLGQSLDKKSHYGFSLEKKED